MDVLHVVHQFAPETRGGSESYVRDVVLGQGIPAVVTLHDFYSSCPRAFRMRKGDAACRRPLSVQSCIDCVPRFGHEPREELAAGIELFADSYRSELLLASAVLVAVG